MERIVFKFDTHTKKKSTGVDSVSAKVLEYCLKLISMVLSKWISL